MDFIFEEMSDPTLFRTEVITKLSETVDNVKSIAQQALELAQNAGTGGSDEVYDAADEVQEADEEVVENLLNYDEYDFSTVLNNTSVFIVNSCKARKYQDGTMRFFLTITTKAFPAIAIHDGASYECLVSDTHLCTNNESSIGLKIMGEVEWVYINRLGLICNLSAFAQCSPGEQYNIACELEGTAASSIAIKSTVPKQTIEVSMPEGTKAYDYTYDITTEVNNLQSKTQTNITFTSIRMTIRNYDRYYVRFSYVGTFGSSRNRSTSAQALTSDYITASTELYPSPSSVGGYSNFLPYIYPTLGLQFINQEAVSEGQEFITHATIICPLSATMTINTSNLKQLETNGGKLKATSAATVQSSLVKYKFIELNDPNLDSLWIGSINFVQDQLGVFVILSIGFPRGDGSVPTILSYVDGRLGRIHLPISLNTRLEVYKHLKNVDDEDCLYYIIGSAGNIALALKKDREGNIILNIDYYIAPDIEPNLQGQGFCIHGLIPGAYLHTEETVYPPPPPEPA